MKDNATKTKNEANVTRRGFMATIGVGAAALALPADVAAAATNAAGPARFAAGTWAEAVHSWPAAVEAMKAQTDAIVAQFTPAYFAEVRRLAEENRERFAPGGDLRSALGDSDGHREQKARDRVEALCAERFGLEVEEHGYEEPEGDAVLGAMICRISPSATEWDVDGDEDGNWNHPCYAAEACAGSDVLAVVRAWGVRS